MQGDAAPVSDATSRVLAEGIAAGRVRFDDASGRWFVTGYDAARAILADRSFAPLVPSRDLPPGLPPALAAAAKRGIEVQTRWMGKQNDTHLRIRALVASLLAPRSLSSIEPRLRARARGLLDALIARGQGDLVADFAGPFVRESLLDLMGFEPKHRAAADRCRLDIDNYGRLAPDAVLRAGVAQAALIPILEGMLDSAAPEGAMILAAVQAGRRDGRIDRDEAVSLLSLLLIGGISTSQDAIGDLVSRLAKDESLRSLVQDGARLDRLVEESVRLGSLRFSFTYIASRDQRVGGTVIPIGTHFVLDLAGANLDPGHFPDAARFDPARFPDHLAFGIGLHRCIGRHLVQLEMIVAAQVMVELFHHLPMACLSEEVA